MEPNNPIVQLCILGTQAEYSRQPAEARRLYEQAWDAAADAFERCVAAHYVARLQETPEERLRWNQVALDQAHMVQADQVQDFYPSLYLNLGQSYELLGSPAEAQRYYDLAARAGFPHQAENG